MDPLGVTSMEEPVKASRDLIDDSLEEPLGTAAVSLPYEESSPEKLPSYDHDLFNDIFGDAFISSKPNSSLFSLDEGGRDYSFSSLGQGGSSTIDNLEEAVKNEGISLSSSLFDDLLDFSSPGTSEIDNILKDNMAKLKPVPQVDLLFGVDDDNNTCSEVQPEVKVKNPDILEFVEIPYDLPEVPDIDDTDGLSCDSLNDGWSLVKEVSLVTPEEEQPPNIFVTSSELDLDTAKEGDTKMDHEEEKTDESIKEKIVEKADDNKEEVHNQDFDFSVLQLPESSSLNFDHFKHKRNISQKGSIANRKKPKRSTIQHNSEDSIFLDSTEPKPQKLEAEDDKDGESSPNDDKEDKIENTETNVPEEASPSRKLAGGIKIPGLLEGLSKSKAFNKMGKESPEKEPDSVPQATSLTSASEKDESPTPRQPTISSSLKDCPSFISPKPVVLPRVLPKPTNKTLKETQNQATSGGIVARSSSFKATSTGPLIAEKPSFLKTSTALSRSASVKVTGASTNKDPEKFSLEKTAPSFGVSKFTTPTKPEIKNSSSATSPKPQIKAPPPVPSKPLIAAKPNRASLRLSASFAGVRSPLLSETRTESTNIPSKTSDQGKILNGKDITETTTTNSEHTTALDVSLSTDRDSNIRKSYSFDKKNVEAQVKTNAVLENKTVDSGETESLNQTTLSRVSSMRKTFQSGYFANAGFKPTEISTHVVTRKDENLDTDDVFEIKSASTDKSSDPDSSSSLEKLDNSNINEEIITHRKSSISGITPVKSPLSSDKTPTGAMPRKGSITGSAYNPIGFRSTLGSSSDSDQKSRGSSFSSTVDAVSSVDHLPLTSASSQKPRDDSFRSSEVQKSRDGSFNSTIPGCVGQSPDKPLDSTSEKIEAKSGYLTETKTPIFLRKANNDTKNETVNEVKANVREPVKALRDSTFASTTNGSPENTKGGVTRDRNLSPWNVQLKKVEKKEPVKPEAVIKTEDPQSMNWRQQLSMRSKNPPVQKDSEKPKQDNTPEWAKTSIKRRQRLIDSGVIRSDT